MDPLITRFVPLGHQNNGMDDEEFSFTNQNNLIKDLFNDIFSGSKKKVE